MILRTVMQRRKLNIDYISNPQKAPHILYSRASCGVSVVKILEKIDHVIRAQHYMLSSVVFDNLHQSTQRLKINTSIRNLNLNLNAEGSSWNNIAAPIPSLQQTEYNHSRILWLTDTCVCHWTKLGCVNQDDSLLSMRILTPTQTHTHTHNLNIHLQIYIVNTLGRDKLAAILLTTF